MGASVSTLKEVIHHVIASTDPSELGATKLNKVLWFADLDSYRQFGRSVTGATSYRKLQFGPVPNDVNIALNILGEEGKISEATAETPAGPRREFFAVKKAKSENLQPEVVNILDNAIRWVCRHSAATISEMTHDALWDEVDFGEQIPLAAASVVTESPSEDDFIWAQSTLKRQ